MAARGGQEIALRGVPLPFLCPAEWAPVGAVCVCLMGRELGRATERRASPSAPPDFLYAWGWSNKDAGRQKPPQQKKSARRTGPQTSAFLNYVEPYRSPP